MVAMNSNPFIRQAENMARMRHNAEGPFTSQPPRDLPEDPCHRTREHVAHERFPAGGGEPFAWCPGVGDFSAAVEPPADPFEGIDEAYNNSEW